MSIFYFRNDWGAIILVDERFSKNPTRYTRGLSKWVRGRVEFYPNFAQAEDSLETFTESMIANPPCNRYGRIHTGGGIAMCVYRCLQIKKLITSFS